VKLSLWFFSNHPRESFVKKPPDSDKLFVLWSHVTTKLVKRDTRGIRIQKIHRESCPGSQQVPVRADRYQGGPFGPGEAQLMQMLHGFRSGV